MAWTGNNLKSDRRAAGKELAARLRLRDADPAVTRYHPITHSHGGNMVTHALQEFRPKDLGGVIFLGTPYLSFGDSERKLKPQTVPLICIY